MNKLILKNLLQRIIILFVLVSFHSCKSGSESKRNIISDVEIWNDLKSSNNFIDFAQFVIDNPKSKYIYNALKKYYELRDSLWRNIEDIPIMDCFNNCGLVIINTENQIFFEHDSIFLDELHDSIFTFFLNPDNDENLSEKRNVIDLNGEERMVSKGYIWIEYKPDSCHIFQEVIIEISNSIKAYKEFLSEDWYCEEFNRIDSKRKGYIDSVLKNRVIFLAYDKNMVINKPLPPPPGN